MDPSHWISDQLCKIHECERKTSGFVLGHLLSWGIFFIFFPITFVYCGYYLDYLFAIPPMIRSLGAMKLGVFSIIMGLYLIAHTAWVQHCIGKGTPMHIHPTCKLVIQGPYKLIRNPMGVGFTVFYFGLSIMAGTWSMMLIILPVYIIVGAWHLIAVEEKELEKRFGKEYVEYKKNVKRFVPYLF